MEQLKAIIIDDEEAARNTLNSFLTLYCNDIQIVAMCSNVPDAVIAINKYKPHVVFLDIEMPEYSGFELLSFFREIDFEIVFVTAYSEYAVRAFEISAVDYLLKPVDIDQLKNAVEKFKTNIQERLDLFKEAYKGDEIRKIALPVSDGLLFIEVSDIILLEADGAYTNFYLHNGSKLLISKRIKFFEDILENRPIFFRNHRSHIINLNYIKKYTRTDATIVMENKLAVALARDRKQEFEVLLKNLNIVI